MYKMGEIFNQIELKSTRRFLRENMPIAEQLLWNEIRNKKIGHKFRRQHSIGKFIVDFYSPEAQLIIEIDGDSHFYNPNSQESDASRQKSIESLGLKVIRFTNHEIYNNLEEVIKVIINNLPHVPFGTWHR